MLNEGWRQIRLRNPLLDAKRGKRGIVLGASEYHISQIWIVGSDGEILGRNKVGISIIALGTLDLGAL